MSDNAKGRDTHDNAPESEKDLHDPVEVPDVPGDLSDPEGAGQGRPARCLARLGDDQLDDPLAHLPISEGK